MTVVDRTIGHASGTAVLNLRSTRGEVVRGRMRAGVMPARAVEYVSAADDVILTLKRSAEREAGRMNHPTDQVDGYQRGSRSGAREAWGP